MTQSAECLHPDDVILALVVLAFGESEDSVFTAVSRRIHEAIYNLQLKAEYGPVLRMFTFSTSTLFPYSKQLDTSIRNLQWARLIGMGNPDFNRYFVTRAAKRAYQNLVEPQLPSEAVQVLKKAAGELRQQLGVDQGSYVTV